MRQTCAYRQNRKIKQRRNRNGLRLCEMNKIRKFFYFAILSCPILDIFFVFSIGGIRTVSIT